MELANQVRGTAVGINRTFGGERPSPSSPDAQAWDQVNQPYYEARARLRTVAGVLSIYGPEELADKAEEVRVADEALAAARFTRSAPTGDDRPLPIPPELRQALTVLDGKVKEFAALAAQYVK